MSLPLFFSVCSALLLLTGFGGIFPRFFNSVGLFAILFLASSAIILTIRNEIKYKVYVRTVAVCVLGCLLLIVVKSFYLYSTRGERISKQIAEFEARKEAAMKKNSKGQ